MSTSAVLTQCPRCKQEQAKIVGDQRAVCSLCSKALRRVYQFCWACRREWQGENCSNTCDLPGCALRAALLSDVVITDPVSTVLGCPFFRACPACKTLLTHSGEGCPYIECPQCCTEFCFRCLKEECGGSVGYEFDENSESDDDDDDEEYDYYDVAKPCTVIDNSTALEALGL